MSGIAISERDVGEVQAGEVGRQVEHWRMRQRPDQQHRRRALLKAGLLPEGLDADDEDLDVPFDDVSACARRIGRSFTPSAPAGPRPST